MVVNAYNSAVYYMDMLYLRNDIFLTDIIGYDRLKFSEIYPPKSEIMGTPLQQTPARFNHFRVSIGG